MVDRFIPPCAARPHQSGRPGVSAVPTPTRLDARRVARVLICLLAVALGAAWAPAVANAAAAPVITAVAVTPNPAPGGSATVTVTGTGFLSTLLDGTRYGSVHLAGRRRRQLHVGQPAGPHRVRLGSQRRDQRRGLEVVDVSPGEIVYRDGVDGLSPEALRGFCADWRAVPPAEVLWGALAGSDAVVVAMEPGGRAVGLVAALTDGVLCAHVTLLEVLPAYRCRGIGHALVRRMLERLAGLYAVDLVCDPELLPFYAEHGLVPASAAVGRDPSRIPG